MSRELRVGATCALLGLLSGWAASRLVIPRPEVALLSPAFSCGGVSRYAVTVDFAENARWAIQSGPGFWRTDSVAWSPWPLWQRQPGRIETGRTTEPVILVVQGFGKSNQLSGVRIEGLK